MLQRLIGLCLIGLLLVGCGASKRNARKKTSGTTPSKEVVKKKPPREIRPKEERNAPEVEEDIVNPVPKSGVELYIDTYVQIAKDEMRQYGIPASITLAQGILESGAGEGELVKRANNHFGIKCHDWKGARVYHDDDEKGECFRKYNDPKFSYRDHSLFLTGRSRYGNLFQLSKDDYKGWARGLRAAGYATDKKYPQKLIAIIERHKLDAYDREVLGNATTDHKEVTNTIEQHTVKAGETLYSIARKHQLTVDDLKRYNGLKGNTIYKGQVLYVKPLNGDNNP